MPYIIPERRTKVLLEGADTVGELNFEITNVIWTYTQRMGLDYRTINDVLGALEGAKLEYYRRVATVYETKKIAENGDVYE